MSANQRCPPFKASAKFSWDLVAINKKFSKEPISNESQIRIIINNFPDFFKTKIISGQWKSYLKIYFIRVFFPSLFHPCTMYFFCFVLFKFDARIVSYTMLVFSFLHQKAVLREFLKVVAVTLIFFFYSSRLLKKFLF